MIESLKDYWYLYLVLAALIVVTVIVAKKASKAVRKRNDAMKKHNDEVKRYKYLVDKYTGITREDAEKEDDKELCEGVTAVLQLRLDKSPNPDEEFKNAPEWERSVYALFYFDEDCTESLSFFFRHNEQPLPGEALRGLGDIGETRLRSVAASMYSMYDEDNESVSLDKARVAELDSKFANLYNRERFFRSVKAYILENLPN